MSLHGHILGWSKRRRGDLYEKFCQIEEIGELINHKMFQPSLSPSLVVLCVANEEFALGHGHCYTYLNFKCSIIHVFSLLIVRVLLFFHPIVLAFFG